MIYFSEKNFSISWEKKFWSSLKSDKEILRFETPNSSEIRTCPRGLSNFICSLLLTATSASVWYQTMALGLFILIFSFHWPNNKLHRLQAMWSFRKLIMKFYWCQIQFITTLLLLSISLRLFPDDLHLLKSFYYRARDEKVFGWINFNISSSRWI